MVNLVLTIIAFILILALLVFVHELGHFTAAKLMGVKVNEFAIGFGKNLYQKEVYGTKYSINLVPLGGFVDLEGEQGESSSADSFKSASWGAKVLILVAGVVMNLITAVILFYFFLSNSNFEVILGKATDFNFVGVSNTSVYLHVSDVAPGSLAEGKLVSGSMISSMNGRSVASSEDFQTGLKANLGQDIRIGYRRIESLSLEEYTTISLPMEALDGKPLLGIRFYEAAYVLNYPLSATSAVSHAYNLFGYQLQVLSERLSLSIEKKDAGIIGEQVGSIVAVGVIVGDVVSSGQFGQLINLTALISLSLAFVNLLPFPALDGGHVVIVTIEALTRRKFRASWVDRMNQIGFLLLMALSVVIIFKDVIQFNIVPNIISAVRSILGA